MSTINDKNLIDKLIANDGYFEDDPRAAQIVEFINAWNDVTWGVTWVNESKERQRRYEIASEYIHNPKVIWKAKVN